MPKKLFVVTKHEKVTMWAVINAANEEEAMKIAEEDGEDPESGQPPDWEVGEEEVESIDVEILGDG